ncbi:hypothetical protein DPEC_G00362060 [Dallia pectoralis]|nr:hypothetical protein DPEC_G00362060 [Dallia pectoralis]
MAGSGGRDRRPAHIHSKDQDGSEPPHSWWSVREESQVTQEVQAWHSIGPRAPSVPPSTLASPRSRMASAAPLPVPTENMSSDEGSDPHDPLHKLICPCPREVSFRTPATPKRQLSSEQLAAAEGERWKRFMRPKTS